MEQQHANTDAIMDSNAMSLWCVQVQHVVFLTELFIWLKALFVLHEWNKNQTFLLTTKFQPN